MLLCKKTYVVCNCVNCLNEAILTESTIYDFMQIYGKFLSIQTAHQYFTITFLRWPVFLFSWKANTTSIKQAPALRVPFWLFHDNLLYTGKTVLLLPFLIWPYPIDDKWCVFLPRRQQVNSFYILITCWS